MKNTITIDGCEAAAYAAYQANEVVAIYPITPSSGIAELCDQWAGLKDKNAWGAIPVVQEMQSEAGAAASVHGALQTGALTTTVTASQGLLLMIPSMFKIAGELTPTVFYITARSLACQALSIFGDHSDVMACRSTGFAMIFANSVQETMDFGFIAQAASLSSRVPFLCIMDGFRTSHEAAKIEMVSVDEIRALIDDERIREHRRRAMNPDAPVCRGTAQNPDVYFQGRETVNPFYKACPGIVQETMDKFARITGRAYRLFDYVGDPEAERVIVLMGSGAETAHETVEYLAGKGERVGALKVRLYRPFSIEHFLGALPATTRTLGILDRTKEPGSAGEPLYVDVITALTEGLADGRLTAMPRVFSGRYGLSSKEFTPSMVKAVFDEIAKPHPKNHFTVGIIDDVSHSSLEWDPEFVIEPPEVMRAVFWGLGADGTVGANKNSIKIIGEETPSYAQGYFVYDSKKAGSVTVSHLRFGPKPIRSTYLIQSANFVAVHQFGLLSRYPVLRLAVPGATVLINSPYPAAEVWDHMPRTVQEQIIAKGLKVYVLDGYKVAKDTGMGVRINTIMQTGFFALSGVIPKEEVIAKIKETILKTYGRRGKAIVAQNYAAVGQALAHLREVPIPAAATSTIEMSAVVAPGAPEFVQTITAEIVAGRGDLLPVSKMPVDGTFPTATAQWEKRCISMEGPAWDPELCTQCGECVFVCPHAVVRSKIVDAPALAGAPPGFAGAPAKWRGADGKQFVLGISSDDCTGCALCEETCPAKDKTNPSRRAIMMRSMEGIRDQETLKWNFFLQLPDEPALPETPTYRTVKDVQLARPLFEFSGACTGCGETPYVKLMTQLFGDRMLIANATGCSSIYGGNLPTTPYCVDREGRGPAWNNSLFEDTAEFGFGFRLAIDSHISQALQLMQDLGIDPAPFSGNVGNDPGPIRERREAVAALKARLAGMSDPKAALLAELAGALVPRSVWSVGGDGWAYDIGYGGLDHVVAQLRNINLLVLDTEVYSNTGGQQSKATGRAAVAKFAAAGKPAPKKDLGRMAISYGHVYVAQVAMGANKAQTIKAFLEAESYDGPSIIIAYSHCIAHGIDMRKGLDHQKMAVESGYWPLYRYDPRRAAKGRNPMQLDSAAPSIPLETYLYAETRYKMLQQSDPEGARRLFALAQKDVNDRWAIYEKMAAGTGA
jgi:pyruvate-ferredoxin/flavodoxin oxidoreductase